MANSRGAFQGVSQIWQYNRRFYVGTLAALAVALTIAAWLPLWPRFGLIAVAAAAFFWTAGSLAVSHYIYDRSRLYDFSWMAARLGTVVSVANIHAGLDETSGLLQAQFPGTNPRVFDIFDTREMTEPSIARARELSARNADTEAVDWRSLPAADGEFDAVFLIFAAHELRKPESRAAFFVELARVTKPTGAVVLIEHLRDLPNFLAFGPGFLHFFSRRDWVRTAERSGFHVDSEFSITPFVRVFLFRKPA